MCLQIRNTLHPFPHSFPTISTARLNFFLFSQFEKFPQLYFFPLDCKSCPDFEEKLISDFDFVFPPRKSGRGEVQSGPRIRKSIICWIPLPRISSSISLVQLARRGLTLSKYKLVRLPLAGFQPPICLDPHTKRAPVAGLLVCRLTLVQKS